MQSLKRNNYLHFTATVLLFIVSLNAVAAGYSFMRDPTGGGLGISTTYLRSSAPFRDYTIPGIVLFWIIGIAGCVVAVATIAHYRAYKILLQVQGTIIIGWIVIQLMMVVSFHPLHLIIGVSGAILFYIGAALQRGVSNISQHHD